MYYLNKVFNIRRSMRLSREALKRGDYGNELHYGSLAIIQATLWGAIIASVIIVGYKFYTR